MAPPTPVESPAAVVSLPRRQVPAPAAKGKKSAFTLRVDAYRHLRLRLATAITGRSAQLLVTEALDRHAHDSVVTLNYRTEAHVSRLLTR